MLKLKIILIIFSLFTVWQTIKNKTISEDAIKPTVYFTLWKDNAFKNHFAMKELGNEFKKFGYAIKGTPPQNLLHFDFKRNNDINFIAWTRFQMPHPEQKEQSYLWQLESPISIQIPTPLEYTFHFNRIFTWHKPSTDDKQIIYLPIPYAYNQTQKTIPLKEKTILTSLIYTYSHNYHYPLRHQAIQWFLTHHPKDIVFYGKDWDKFKTKLPHNVQKNFDTQYKGYAQDKIDTISKTKFSFAFENYRKEDYVTEKIYDIMSAKSVPIYSGAPNIHEHVPSSCFIDYHQFNSFERLYDFLINMDDATYQSYIDCIEKFMTNPERHPNHYKNVVKTILSYIEL